MLISKIISGWQTRVDRVAIEAALVQREGIVLNVTGPHESKCSGIERATCAFVKRLIARVQEGATSVDTVKENVDADDRQA